MIVLDTNIISEFDRRTPDENAVEWLNEQDPETLCTCAPVVTELWFGARIKEIRTGSSRYISAFEHFVSGVLADRVLPFDREAAIYCADMRASGVAAGRTRPPLDAMIAAICIANGAALATRNAVDFADLDLRLINPFEPA